MSVHERGERDQSAAASTHCNGSSTVHLWSPREEDASRRAHTGTMDDSKKKCSGRAAGTPSPWQPLIGGREGGVRSACVRGPAWRSGRRACVCCRKPLIAACVKHVPPPVSPCLCCCLSAFVNGFQAWVRPPSPQHHRAASPAPQTPAFSVPKAALTPGPLACP